MDTAALLLPAQLSALVWAPAVLLTLGCAAWLMFLLRDEPGMVAAVVTTERANALRRRIQRSRRAARPLAVERKPQRRARVLQRRGYRLEPAYAL